MKHPVKDIASLKSRALAAPVFVASWEKGTKRPSLIWKTNSWGAITRKKFCFRRVCWPACPVQSRWAMVARGLALLPCPPGGTGRHARLRSVCRKAWEFESLGGYKLVRVPVNSGNALRCNRLGNTADGIYSVSKRRLGVKPRQYDVPFLSLPSVTGDKKVGEKTEETCRDKIGAWHPE